MLLIVRHGRTDANAKGLLLGRADPGLDAVGETQAMNLAAEVGEVDRVVSSPLLRCRQTAAQIASTVEVDDRFVELDYGDFDGQSGADLGPAVWDAWRRDLSFVPPNGESLAAMALRVREGLADLAEVAINSRIVVVTHVSPIKVALAWALGVGDEVSWRSYVAPASIMRIGVSDSGPMLRSFNEVKHLMQ